MSETLKRIQELQAQRAQLCADIDREIDGLKAKALAEVDAMKATLAQYQTALGGNVYVAAQPDHKAIIRPHADIDETDAGAGVAEIENNVSANSFKDELTELRNRNMARRRRA